MEAWIGHDDGQLASYTQPGVDKETCICPKQIARNAYFGDCVPGSLRLALLLVIVQDDAAAGEGPIHQRHLAGRH